MRRTLPLFCSLAIFAVAILVDTRLPLFPRAVPTAFAQAFKTRPLYRFQSALGNYLYTTNSELPPDLSDGPWENEGIACHIPIGPNHTVQTKPVYQFGKTDDLGARFFFTSSISRGDTAMATGWTKQGVGFYVASTQVPGTLPLYEYYKPVIPETKKDQSWWDKVKEALAGPEFTQAGAAVLQDSHFYTIRKDEGAAAKKGGFSYVGIIGYVWESPYPPPAALAPDLLIVETTANEFSVTAIVTNQGTGSTGGVKYDVSLLVFDKNDELLYKLNRPAPGLSPNQSNQVKFDTGGKSLGGKRYQVKIDEPNAVDESNEDNNETAILPGPGVKLKPPANSGETTKVALVIGLTDRQEHDAKGVGGRPVKRIDYLLKVGNTNPFPNAWYQPLTVLPPTTCAAVPTNARLLMEIRWKLDKDGPYDKAGFWKLGVCKPLLSPQDLTGLKFSMNDERAVPDHLMIIVRDRLTGIIHESNDVPVGAFGVAGAIYPLGCFAFLGRADEFVCKTKVGFEACENLRKHGKPIKCRMAPTP